MKNQINRKDRIVEKCGVKINLTLYSKVLEARYLRDLSVPNSVKAYEKYLETKT